MAYFLPEAVSRYCEGKNTTNAINYKISEHRVMFLAFYRQSTLMRVTCTRLYEYQC